MSDTQIYSLDCTVAAILAAGSLSGIHGGTKAEAAWSRYQEILTLIRDNGGPEQPKIKHTTLRD